MDVRPLRSLSGAALALAAWLMLAPAFAASTKASYALAASATAHTPVAQDGASYRLTARFANAPTVPPGGSGYALAATLTARPLACASDTIFADGFDGP